MTIPFDIVDNWIVLTCSIWSRF